MLRQEVKILTLLTIKGPSYGLDLVKSSSGQLYMGTIYCWLEGMEEKGLLDSIEDSPGSYRRIYRITRLGEEALANHATWPMSWFDRLMKWIDVKLTPKGEVECKSHGSRHELGLVKTEDDDIGWANFESVLLAAQKSGWKKICVVGFGTESHVSYSRALGYDNFSHGHILLSHLLETLS